MAPGPWKWGILRPLTDLEGPCKHGGVKAGVGGGEGGVFLLRYPGPGLLDLIGLFLFIS